MYSKFAWEFPDAILVVPAAPGSLDCGAIRFATDASAQDDEGKVSDDGGKAYLLNAKYVRRGLDELG